MPPYFFAPAPLSWIYSAAMWLRASMYDAGIFRVKRLACPVVSVGNVTAGGTGKTPMVAYIARRLQEAGLKPAILTRGYGGSKEGGTHIVSDGRSLMLDAAESGDEPSLLASLLPGVPVVMGTDRRKAGIIALDKFSPDVLVLDDGFQHMALHRDLNILLMDARRPLGNGMVLPAGYLREPAGACARADIVVLTRTEGLDPRETEASMALASRLSDGRPVLTAVHVSGRVRDIASGVDAGPDCLSGKDVYAFSGIADPASFALILKHLGAKISKFREFSDHYAYSRSEVEEIKTQATVTGAELVVTTEKDAVKLKRLGEAASGILSVGVELEPAGGTQALENLLREKVLNI